MKSCNLKITIVRLKIKGVPKLRDATKVVFNDDIAISS